MSHRSARLDASATVSAFSDSQNAQATLPQEGGQPNKVRRTDLSTNMPDTRRAYMMRHSDFRGNAGGIPLSIDRRDGPVQAAASRAVAPQGLVRSAAERQDAQAQQAQMHAQRQAERAQFRAERLAAQEARRSPQDPAMRQGRVEQPHRQNPKRPVSDSRADSYDRSPGGVISQRSGPDGSRQKPGGQGSCPTCPRAMAATREDEA